MNIIHEKPRNIYKLLGNINIDVRILYGILMRSFVFCVTDGRMDADRINHILE